MKKLLLFLMLIALAIPSEAKKYDYAIDIAKGESRWNFLRDSLTNDLSWKDRLKYGNYKPSGTGTEANPYKISSAEEMAYFLINNDNNTEYWELTADIDMKDAYLPITGNKFRGHFDGHNHTIKNLHNQVNDSKGSSESGLFCKVDMNTVIKNLRLYHCFFKGDGKVGGVIGVMHETNMSDVLRNVHLDEVLLVSHGNNIGGLVGRMENVGTRPYIRNCSFNGDIYLLGGGSTSAGGLVGYSENSKLSLEYCIVERGIDKASNNDGLSSWEEVGNFIGHFWTKQDDRTLEVRNCVILNSNLTANSKLCHGFAIGKVDKISSPISYMDFVMDKNRSTGDAIGNYLDSKYYGTKQLSNGEWTSGNLDGEEAMYVPFFMNDRGSTEAFSWDSNAKRLSCRMTDDSSPKPYYGHHMHITDNYGLIKSITGKWGALQFDYGKTHDFYINNQVTGVEMYETWKDDGLWYDEQVTAKTFQDYTATNITFSPQRSKIPVPQLTTPRINGPERKVTLTWDYTKYSKENKAIKALEGSRYEIYRNGVKIDTLATPYATTFTDSIPVMGNETITYKVSWLDEKNSIKSADLIADSVTIDNIIYTPTLTATNKDKAIALKLMIPSLKDLSGSTVTFFRQEGSDASTKKKLGTTKYSYRSSVKTVCDSVTYEDSSNLDQCITYTYSAEIGDFATSSSWAEKTMNSSEASARAEIGDKLLSFNCEKGHSENSVKLTWKVKRTSPELMYIVSRRLAKTLTSDNDEWKNVYTTTSTASSLTYNDPAQPGYIYEYKVTMYAPCESTYDENAPVASLSDIGFATSLGTIMGRISYGTGTSVQNVSVTLSQDETTATMDNSYSSVRSEHDRNYISAPVTSMEGKWDGSWTMQLMLHPTSTTEQTAVTLPNGAKLTIKDYKASLGGGTAVVSVPEGTFTHVVVRHNKNGYSLSSLINDSLTTVRYAAYAPTKGDYDDLRLCGNGTDAGLEGFMDELRIWSRELTDQEILDNANRFLSGSEKDLQLYYTFDEGSNDMVFDHSNPKGRWNDNHGTYVTLDTPEEAYTPVCASNVIPAESLLAARGKCDENGEYIIAGIPYSGTGTTYSVVPSLGIHEFTPNKSRRLVSSESLVNTGVDFTDVSSFRLEVQAYHSFGNYPAQGLGVMVDGVAQTASGNVLQTDSRGRATVSVPIGRHRVTLAASGHTMLADGSACTITNFDSNGNPKYEVLGDNADGYYDFQADVPTTFTYYDMSMARVVGRVVGGSIEAEKNRGTHESKNNIGQVTITFQPENSRSGQYFNYEGEGAGGVSTGDIVIASSCGDSIPTTTTYFYRSDKIEVTTDANTGEFMAMLPPVSMKVTDIKSVKSNGLTSSDFELEKLVTTFQPQMEQAQWDSIKADTTGMNLNIYKGDTIPYTKFYYHSKRDFTYYVQPQIVVTRYEEDSEADSLMLGEQYYMYSAVNPTTNEEQVDTLNLWQSPYDGTSASYLTGYPIFYTNNTYNLKIRAFEKYRNYDTDEESRVPLRGVTFNIQNRLATQAFTTRTTWSGTNKDYSYELVDTLAETSNGTLSADGVVTYEFVAGYPNPTSPYTLGMNITYTHHGTEYAWPNDQTKTMAQGIVMGGAPIPGSTFVTEGPQKVDIVLSDPPGSTSSAYIEKGSKISCGRTVATASSLTGGYDISAGVGTSFSQSTLGGIVLVENLKGKRMWTTDGGIELSTGHNTNYSRKITYTFKERYSTSSKPALYGARGDVYIGRSMNHIIGMANYVRFLPSTSGKYAAQHNSFSIGKTIDRSMGDTIKTTFAYTQMHITDQLIPELRSLRRGIVTKEVDDLSTAPKTNATNHYVYYVKKGVSDNLSTWVLNSDYVSVAPTHLNKGEVAVDSVMLLSNWIKGWEDAIAEHEELKWYNFNTVGTSEYTYDAAEDAYRISKVPVPYGYLGNKSFSGGVSVSGTTTIANAKNFSYAGNWSLKTTYSTGTTFESSLQSCSTKFVTKTKKPMPSHSNSFGYTDDDEYSTTYGYTLSSDNKDNFYTVDVYNPATTDDDGKVTYSNLPPIFRLRGGQSINYYEGPEYSLYYTDKNNNKVQLSDGTISLVNLQITFPDNDQKRLNVPSGQAVPIRVTISNNSTGSSTANTFLEMCIVAKSNPNGLKAMVGGTDINGTTVKLLLAPGKSLTQTITLQQSRLDVMDYDNIVLLVYSSDQKTLGVQDSMTVHFLPVSSPVSVKTSTTLVNAENESRILDINIGDYNTSAKNFAGIRMQHQAEGETTWTTDYLYLNDSTLYVDSKGIAALPDADRWEKLPDGQVVYHWNMSNLNDGKYNFRAQCFTISGATDEVTTESELLSVTKNTTRPTIMGTPEPANGVWGLDNNISITFNKDINQGSISTSNFYVRGILNDAEQAHSSGITLEGTVPAYVNSRIGLLGSRSFTIGMWYKPTVGKDAVLFSIPTSAGNAFTVTRLANGKMSVDNGSGRNDAVKTSTKTSPDNEWMYAALAYDLTSDSYSLYNLHTTASQAESTLIEGEPVHSEQNDATWLYFGGRQESTDTHVTLSDIALYGTTLGYTEISEQKNIRKSANTTNIVAYWPTDECTGSKAREVVHERQMTLPSANTWYVDATNYALSLNGKDQAMMIYTSPQALKSDQDYRLEMWARTSGKSAAQTLLSGVNDNGNGMRIYIANGNSLKLSDGSFSTSLCDWPQDNGWHHVSLSCTHGGQTWLLLDGERKAQLYSDSLSRMAYNYIMLGATGKVSSSQNGISYSLSDYLKGGIDDVRLWLGRTAESAIQNAMRKRMTGKEDDLLFYYPFEKTVVAGGINTTRTTLDDLTGNSLTAAKLFGFNSDDDATSSIESPLLRCAEEEQTVSISCTPNERTIIIKPTVDIQRLEGSTLTFTVKNVYDTYGNCMANPVTWTASVDQCAVEWFDDIVVRSFDINDNNREFILELNNQSGLAKKWSLGSLPSWLTVKPSSGTIEGYGYKELTAIVSNSLSTGVYAHSLGVTSDNITTHTSLNIAITQTEPDWKVNTDKYSSNMSIVGRLYVNGTPSYNDEDIVAAFRDNECVGVGKPQYDEKTDQYHVFLTIYGNVEDKDVPVSLRVWDALTGNIFSNVELTFNDKAYDLLFNPNAIIGKASNPLHINALPIYTQTLNLNEGWTWMSLWVHPKDNQVNSIFGSVMDDMRSFKSQKESYLYSTISKDWHGDLNRLENEQTYMVYGDKALTLEVSGEKAQPDTCLICINGIESGTAWSWIGYPLSFRTTVSEALADLTPSENDVIKDKSSFAMYDSGRWIGTLSTMEPGHGYLYFSNASQSKTFYYPASPIVASNSSNNGSTRSQDDETSFVTDGEHWQVDHSLWSSNMNVVGRVLDTDGTPMEGIEVVALADDGAHGSAVTGEDGLVFLTVSGNAQKTMCVAVYDNRTEKATDGKFAYVDNDIKGSIKDPVVFRVLDDDNDSNSSTYDGLIYDTSGRRTENIRNTGVYIHGNKKVRTPIKK